MTHIASALFFLATLLATLVVLHMTVSDHLDAITAALRGEMPNAARQAHRSRPQAKIRTRPTVATARPVVPQRRVAA